MNKLKKICILSVMITFSFTLLSGQYTHRKNLQSEKEYIDSLKNTPYPWKLPIMGGQIRKKGFDLPNPNGLMANYIFGVQDITMENLAIGTQDDPSTFTDVSNIVGFDHITARVQVINFKYDFYLLPFLNFYALGGYVISNTDVALALPFVADFTAHGEGPMFGWGTVFSGGVGPFIFSTDYNMAWTYLPQLDGPSLAQVFDFRLGHMFKFKNRPQMNLVALIGTSYQKLAKSSVGSWNVSEMVGFSQEEKEDALNNLNDWYDDLPQHSQDQLEGIYDGFSGWLENGEDTYLRYSFDKRLYYPWSMTLGLNYQLNHRYQFSFMYTVLGSRSQYLFGLNYRFGFRGKNYLAGLTL